MSLRLTSLIQQLQEALDANDGNDMWVELRPYDDPPEYGYREAIAVYPDETSDSVVITYN